MRFGYLSQLSKLRQLWPVIKYTFKNKILVIRIEVLSDDKLLEFCIGVLKYVYQREIKIQSPLAPRVSSTGLELDVRYLPL